MSHHVALLGDSIFDNRRYTEGQPDVITHLRSVLPSGSKASLLAVDGSITDDLQAQVDDLRPEVTRVVVAIGGNDALMHADILDHPVASTREALLLFGQRVAMFERSYRAALSGLVECRKPVTVCTIYNGNFPPDEAPTTRVALMLFNDVILRVAFDLRISVIDLRAICSAPSDYANPIEPSGRGGHKIALAIVASLGLTDADAHRTAVYAG